MVPGATSAPVDRVVAQAQGAYWLRNYQTAADLLEPLLTEAPERPGARRVLGQALARLNREEEALRCLSGAVCREPDDWLARASLASLMLRRGEPAAGSTAGDAVAHLTRAQVSAPAGAATAMHELLGAAEWRAGQEALKQGHDREAARRFAAAGTQFERAAAATATARRERPARSAAAFVGQAVALLLAGETATAQRLFSRLSGSCTETEPMVRFAAGLYELCEELAQVTVEERAATAAALRTVVLETRLEVGFYDGRWMVNLVWHGGTR